MLQKRLQDTKQGSYELYLINLWIYLFRVLDIRTNGDVMVIHLLEDRVLRLHVPLDLVGINGIHLLYPGKQPWGLPAADLVAEEVEVELGPVGNHVAIQGNIKRLLDPIQYPHLVLVGQLIALP